MTWRQYLLLALLGLFSAGVVALFQPTPGYIDADYYYSGGLELATGHGFTENFIWNYLDDPAGLPHPSNAYWMPLASLLAAAGAALFGSSSWTAARIGFLAIAACIPPVTAALAYSLTSKQFLAMISGLLAVFSAFYLKFIPTTDTFGLYMLLGGSFFLLLGRRYSNLTPLFLGLLAGLFHLSRVDGLLWLGIALLATIFLRPISTQKLFVTLIRPVLFCLAGYLLIMGPWLVRNWLVFGTPLAPGGSFSLWLTDYNQLFSYPASQLSFSNWWASGIPAILTARLWALLFNLANTLAVQGEIFLLPLICLGLWLYRRDQRIQIAVLSWGLTIFAMTLIFPFAGSRGGFIHSGAALQPVWWAVAPAGLDWLISVVAKWRRWKGRQAYIVFPILVVTVTGLLTTFIIFSQVIGMSTSGSVWNQENSAYQKIGQYLSNEGAPETARVIIANPPGFYLATGHPSIALPDGNVDTIIAVADRYGADYLILEKESLPGVLMAVYNNPNQQAGLQYLGEKAEARIFVIHP